MSVSLSKKAVILVTVPLAFEVIFVVTLAYLLHQVQYERQRENHAREISTHVNGALTALLDRFSSCVLYHVSDSAVFRQRFAAARVKITGELLVLEDLVRPYPEEKAGIDYLNDMFVICGEDLQRAQRMLESGDKMQAASMWAKADKSIEKILKAIEGIVSQQEQNLRQRQAAQEQYIKVVEGTLFFALLFNVGLASSLVIYFNRGTTKRLNTLMDNTLRLAIAKPLNAPLSGNDEIAHLDSTFRKMASALAESRRKEQAVIDNAADVICTIGRSGLFTAINPAARGLWGFEPDEMIDQPISSVIMAEDFKATLKSIEEIIASPQQEGAFENRIVCADKSIRDCAWSAHWSETDKSLFCVARDITERKEVDRMKRDFVAMISHDLRTPLTSIQMALALIAAEAYGQISDNGHEKLAAAEANVDRLIGLVSGLLDLEKMESGKLELVLEVCPISSIVKPSLAAITGFADQQGVKLIVPDFSGWQAGSQAPVAGASMASAGGSGANSAGTGSTGGGSAGKSTNGTAADHQVFADRDRMVQVVINLISNAIKFSPRGGAVTLAVEAEPEFIKVSIIDQGRGVPPHMHDAVFDRFKQVEVADEKVKGGSGLGLAICKAIVERHGGQIGVDSLEGRGSTFWFRLPQGVVKGARGK